MEITGKIIEIFDTQQVTESFKKREFVVEYNENAQYPELIKFELNKDKCDGLNAYSVGDTINVHFNLRGRAWENKQGVKQYFNTLQAWKYSKV